ncbi:hypothetical protein ACFFVB_13695 [Formosa undariae]|uniref:Uncharacterized protein n=1 Tax=Formosa undariae TaxID=1325436 RepID=A0ABV5F3W3_9FLAO
MKLTIIHILLLLCIVFEIPGYAQSEQDMTHNSISIPLKIGENPSIHFQTLKIEPVNLFKPLEAKNKHVSPIQLELKITENNTEHTTFLWHNTDAPDSPKTNYPKAFNDYVFSLTINKEDVALVVEKLNYGTPFFIDLGQTAVIKNITVLFETCIGEWSEDLNGNQVAAFNTYSVSLCDENNQETISFTSLDTSVKNELVIAWKNYKFLVLEDSENALKLMILEK